MNLSNLVRLATATIIIFLTSSPSAFTQIQELGRIQGRVLIEGTREPIDGAIVQAIFSPLESKEVSAEPVEVITDSNGLFSVNWIRSGLWRLTVSLEGFTSSAIMTEVTQSRSNSSLIELSMAKVVDPMYPIEAPSVGQLAGLRADDIQTKIDAAHNFFDNGRYDDSIALYEVVLKQVPLLTSLHLQIGHAYRAKQDYELALIAYRAVPADTSAGGEAESAIKNMELLGLVH